ncbi:MULTISPECIES: alpha-hydroxy acid oxidase [unclassified Acinetobacter]|uniref:alpha-hydroxy acid oxidase n=1 Tax=unclassified Acinetobacter TaxID=196816 RepID=UPI0015D340BC|nr:MULTISPECIES: alpha-hydroxy acid oxidase [unclassified Acinetobacter]
MRQHSPLQPLTQIPAHLQTIADYEKEAELHLSHMVWQYLQGGSMDEHSVRGNLSQFEQIQLLPRMLKDLTQGHTQIEILGQRFPHPIFVAPIGHQQQFHPDAEAATALAAEVLGSNMILSTFTNTDMRELKQDNPFKWFQLYWQGEREKSLSMVKMAEAHGFKAIVVTVDSPHSGIRDRERHAFFELPKHEPQPHHFVSQPKTNQSEHPLFQGLMKIAPTWADILWLSQNTSLPIILKGIVSPHDAELALQHGVQGIIVSNHGGRVLDGCISPLTALELIKKVVPTDFPVLYDGGIRRGSDVFKAIALGASAVLVGRPCIYGLATAGALGVAHVLKILKEEFEITMALMGTATVDEINKDYIFQKS